MIPGPQSSANIWIWLIEIGEKTRFSSSRLCKRLERRRAKKLGPPTSILADVRKHHFSSHRTSTAWIKIRVLVLMDSPLLSQLFRQLFNHRACQCSRSTTVRRLNGTRHSAASLQYQQQSRSFLSRREPGPKKSVTNDGTMWTKRDDYPRDLDHQLRTFPLVTAKDLRNRRERPRQVKMLTREFIEGMHMNAQEPG